MCGITGFFKKTTSYKHSVNQIINQMTVTLKHRGPDDEGYVLWNDNSELICYGNSTTQSVKESHFAYSPTSPIQISSQNFRLALGHRRLSIVDLTPAGHQPMSFSNNNFWIVFNGEIYNYKSLKNTLRGCGHNFISETDTEVILAAYKEFGVDCLSHFNGMWAFVIYDKSKNILFGARDRFGVKPLYYSLSSDFFAFASEQKALLTIPQNKSILNQKAVFNFLAQSSIDNGNEGFHKNIIELLPSEFFIFDCNSLEFSKTKYYDLPVNLENEKFDCVKNKLYVENCKSLLFSAVESRLHSDVPIGFCLSGGVDSSSLVSVANKINQRNKIPFLGSELQVFTAVNDSVDKDESKWAKNVADDCNSLWHKAYCEPSDLMFELSNIIYYQDLPLLSMGTYAQYKVMQKASESNIPILLDGQGGDELFAGYVEFYVSQCLNLMKQKNFARLYQELKKIQNAPISIKLYIINVLKIYSDRLPLTLKKILFSFSKPESMFLQKDFLKEYENEISISGNFSSLNVNSLLKNHFENGYLKSLLHWEDRCSMAFGIESRTPFSDDLALIEYVFSIPSNYKIVNGWSKYLLRESMKNTVNEKNRLRTDKLGYATPQTEWIISINKQLKDIIYSADVSFPVVHKNILLKKWDKIILEGNHKKIGFIWRYANFLLWENTIKM